MESYNEIIINFLNSIGAIGPIFACFLILVESILPFLPLAVFIGINFLTFGHLLGFLISWCFTVIGCIMSFMIFRKGLNEKFNLLIKNRTKILNLMERFSNISLGKLTILIAVPFTPAFMINIAAGLTNMDFKKYFIALLIGKVSLVYFWGYVSVSLIDAIKNPIILLKIGLIILFAYIISKIITKMFNI